MPIEFDPANAADNVRKHGVSFADAEVVLSDPTALTVEDAGAVGEHRHAAIGLGGAGEVLVVVWTERGDAYRLISARRATRKERRAYED